MGVVFDDQIKKLRRGLLRLHIERDAVVCIVINEMDLIVRRSAGAQYPGNRSALQDAVVLERHIRQLERFGATLNTDLGRDRACLLLAPSWPRHRFWSSSRTDRFRRLCPVPMLRRPARWSLKAVTSRIVIAAIYLLRRRLSRNTRNCFTTLSYFTNVSALG